MSRTLPNRQRDAGPRAEHSEPEPVVYDRLLPSRQVPARRASPRPALLRGAVGWAFKGNVVVYRASIPHDPLWARLSRGLADPDVLRVLGRILRAYPPSPGRALPIGALTSRHSTICILGP